jgi:glycosyltransferase involved in cell wall biosynthesis
MDTTPGSRGGLTALANLPLRIALAAPPQEAVPPAAYGGTERVIFELVRELTSRGHEVTLFAAGDSQVPCELVPTVSKALRPANQLDAEQAAMISTVLDVVKQADRFDLIHAHLEWFSPLLTTLTTTPVAMTFHGRLDYSFARNLLGYVPHGMIAVSAAQMAAHEDLPGWEGVVHNGLNLSHSPFSEKRSDALVFVGRISPEKAAAEAIEIARRCGRPLKIAAKRPTSAPDVEYYEAVFKPAMAGADVEYLGELSGSDRDRLLAESYATLMPGSWPEPFGLVAIESLACGTPVIARHVGALPEIIRDGVDGFFGDDAAAMAFRIERVGELDRRAIRESVIVRFSAKRMADAYERIYMEMLTRGVNRTAAAGSEAM